MKITLILAAVVLLCGFEAGAKAPPQTARGMCETAFRYKCAVQICKERQRDAQRAGKFFPYIDVQNHCASMVGESKECAPNGRCNKLDSEQPADPSIDKVGQASGAAVDAWAERSAN